MPKHRNLLIVIADGEHARFVRLGPGNIPHTDAAFDSTAAHQRSRELGSDRPGASFHTGSVAHHSLVPRHDPHFLAKEAFANLIADQLNTAVAQGAFDQLILVAPPHILIAVRKDLDSAANARIVGSLQKDLAKVPDKELWAHIAPLLLLPLPSTATQPAS